MICSLNERDAGGGGGGGVNTKPFPYLIPSAILISILSQMLRAPREVLTNSHWCTLYFEKVALVRFMHFKHALWICDGCPICKLQFFFFPFKKKIRILQSQKGLILWNFR